MTPLQLPGGPELLVLLLMFFVMAVSLALVVYGVRRVFGNRDDDRIEELETRVDELESKVEE